MIKTIESIITEQNAQAVKYLNVQGLKDSKGTINKINSQINRDFGLAGPLTLSTPSLRVHAIRWAAARESFVVETNVNRVLKETIASGISKTNKCAYCTDVHSASIASAGDSATSIAITNGTWKSLHDAKKKEIIEWSLNTRNPHANIIQNPPFSIQDAPEIIGTALTFHSTNRLVSIFLDESPLPVILNSIMLKKTALKIASKTLFKSMVMKKAIAGDSLQFIEDFPVSKSLDWSKGVPVYSKVLAAENTLLHNIEKEVIPRRISQLFKEMVNKWEGEEMPLGRKWLLEMTKDLANHEKPIATLVFLSAFAPNTITLEDMEAFRKVKPTDTELVETCFWSVQTITDRISKWLTKPF